nr:hypothetical protein [Tanacetum cinerariifolium]
MNQNFFVPNPCYEPNSSSFDQYQPLQSFATQQIHQRSNEDIRLEMAKLIKNNRILLNNNIFPHEEAKLLPQLLNDSRTIDEMVKQHKQYQPEEIQELMCKLLKDFQIKREELAECINSLSWNHPTFYNNDEEHSIKYNDDELLFDEDVPMENFKVYSNPLFDDEEINSDKIDPHCFNAEYDLIESLSNRINLFDSSPKFDYLEEFSGELLPTSIINEERIKREHEEYISVLWRSC